MKKTLIVHIGVPKTGSSAIQQFFRINQEAIEKSGFFYPSSCVSSDYSHNELVFLMHENAYRSVDLISASEQLSKIKNDFEKSGCHTLVISSECFSSFPEDSIFLEFIENYNLKVIAYLRNPYDYLESWYKQWVEDRFYKLYESFDVFFDKHSDGLHFKYLQQWGDVAGQGNLNVIDFDKVKSNLICDFVSRIGLEQKNANAWVYPGKVNRSLTFAECEVQKVLNRLNIDIPIMRVNQELYKLPNRSYVSLEQKALLNMKYDYSIFFDKYSSF